MEKEIEKELGPACAYCNAKVRLCRSEEGEGPAFCPTKTKARENQVALQKYADPETMDFARAASLQEAECYLRREEKPFVPRPSKTRVEEIVEFAQKMGYRKLGVAFCFGLFSEAATFVRILEKHGFEVISVCCKVGEFQRNS